MNKFIAIIASVGTGIIGSYFINKKINTEIKNKREFHREYFNGELKITIKNKEDE